MKISVIIPSYNRRQYIGETIKSILGQTAPPEEIIVVDDGSSDRTVEYVRDTFPSVRCLAIPNSGPVVARIRGIEQARFDWIALCDSDDVWLPDMLERRQRMHAQHPDAVFSFSDFRMRPPSGPEPVSMFQWIGDEYWRRFGCPTQMPDVLRVDEPPYLRIVESQPVWPSTSLFSMELYRRVGGLNERFSRWLSEDLEFTLRCAEHTPWLVDMRAMVWIRQHDSNFSNSQGRTKLLLGELGILDYASRTHRTGSLHRKELVDEMVRRARPAIDRVFGDGDMDGVKKLAGFIPWSRYDARLLAKAFVCRLPQGVATAMASRLVSP